jgi:hypothetical protein
MITSLGRYFRFASNVGRSSQTAPSKRTCRRAPAFELLEDRIALNNRFVVPLGLPADNFTFFHSLSAALTTTGLANSDVIQVQAGSTPGALNDVDLPAFTNLVIRGDPNSPLAELPNIASSGAISVDATQQGLVLDHLNLTLTAGLTLNATAAIRSCNISVLATADGIALNATANATLTNNTMVNNGVAFPNALIRVNTVAGAGNLIAGNTIVDKVGATLLNYSGTAAITDLISGNTILGHEGVGATAMMVVNPGVAGLRIEDNIFRDSDAATSALVVSSDTQGISVFRNSFDLPGSSGRIIQVGDGLTGVTTATVARNSIRAGPSGTGLFLQGVSSIKIEGNKFVQGAIGVAIDAALPNSIDLGGGATSSLGGNNFRIFKQPATSTSGAIVVAVISTPISARFNLFGTADPETAVFDNGDNGSLADVVTTDSLTGNAAFVQALYLEFLRRAGDTNNPNDAGGWVALLNNNAAVATVVNGIVRSTEAFGFVVEDAYHRLLARGVDSAGRSFWVSFLQNGGTLEAFQAGLFASAEYQSRFGTDRFFVLSLYEKLLGRFPTEPEIAGHVAALPAIGRLSGATLFVLSAEYRAREIRRFYADVLKRANAPSNAEVNAWVSSGLDLVAITAAFAASAEFQANG